jgi:hypothetical protein
MTESTPVGDLNATCRTDRAGDLVEPPVVMEGQ